MIVTKSKLILALRSCFYWEGVHKGDGSIDLERYIEGVLRYLKKY